jgi:hypothetical protein
VPRNIRPAEAARRLENVIFLSLRRIATPMSHIFFFSYAHNDRGRDNQIEIFFEDLCNEVAQHTPWALDDQRVSFRDGNNLALMQQWRPALLNALQESAVLVCVTSPRYFASRFCGQEYYLFDERRRAAAENRSPPA